MALCSDCIINHLKKVELMETESYQMNKTELNIGNGEQGEASSLTINGLPPDLHKSPEKIRALLDLLELPKGTRVTVNFQASSSIVR